MGGVQLCLISTCFLHISGSPRFSSSAFSLSRSEPAEAASSALNQNNYPEEKKWAAEAARGARERKAEGAAATAAVGLPAAPISRLYTRSPPSAPFGKLPTNSRTCCQDEWRFLEDVFVGCWRDVFF